LAKNGSKTRFVLVLLSAAAVLAVSSWFVLRYVDSRVRFEKTRWLQAREEESWGVRSAMAKDLINRNALIGQTRDQVIALLGEPEKYSDASPHQLYYLVREEWDWIDPARRDHLVVSTDESGRTIAAKIDIFQQHRP
jgi:hypothetical protein